MIVNKTTILIHGVQVEAEVVLEVDGIYLTLNPVDARRLLNCIPSMLPGPVSGTVRLTVGVETILFSDARRVPDTGSNKPDTTDPTRT
jgi:hypothetical protein